MLKKNKTHSWIGIKNIGHGATISIGATLVGQLLTKNHKELMLNTLHDLGFPIDTYQINN